MQAKTTTFTAARSSMRELTIITFFATLTALGARVAIPLPFSPVPITLQVLMVILAGLVLGSRRGLLSQLEYVAAGALGLPVFAGGSGGLAVVLGPTGGYLVAFPLAAFVAGLISERLNRHDKASAFVASLAAIVIIYGSGVLWLATWLGMTREQAPAAALIGAWYLGVKPFILVDLAKAAVAATVVGGGRAFLSQLLCASGRPEEPER